MYGFWIRQTLFLLLVAFFRHQYPYESDYPKIIFTRYPIGLDYIKFTLLGKSEFYVGISPAGVNPRNIYAAEVGDKCTQEAWRALTKPYWDAHWNAAISNATLIKTFINAQTGWKVKPEYTGKSCWNVRHIASKRRSALALQCGDNDMCECLNQDFNIGPTKFKLIQGTTVYFKMARYFNIISAESCKRLEGSICNDHFFPCSPGLVCVSDNEKFLCKESDKNDNRITVGAYNSYPWKVSRCLRLLVLGFIIYGYYVFASVHVITHY